MEVQAPESVKRLDALYEFDRQPVTNDRLLGPAYFAGSYAGEHVAATEFVIGALFVSWGAGFSDILIGLAIGNLLAVLSWTLLCAPVAVQTRLTLYWYLRKIGGPVFTLIYNVLNALLFCVLAGCMITVSASAVRIPFGIPPQVDWYPTDLRFVLIVLLVGAVVVALAILGFKKLASFATVCSPWMLLMFVSGAAVMLPVVGDAAGVGAIDSWAALAEASRRVVWTGQTPDGSPPITLMQIAAFAWICNLAMHGGLSDMALLRYARRASYGLFSAFGMFLGHYLAWICAGLMGGGVAVLLGRSLPQLDAGEVGFQALGWAGVLAVVIAGWTTSNPTLYRAGLALQAVTPNWSRARVTLVAGAVTTVIACFPFVFTRLLEFVGIYGLLLAPPGAIVLVEHWIFPRIGLQRYWAEQQRRALNVPAAVAWGVSIAMALALERSGTLHLFYLFVPTYLTAAVLYTVLAAMAGARRAVAGMSEPAGEPQPARQPSFSEGPTPMSQPDGRGKSGGGGLAGLVALAALVACLVLPLAAGFGYTSREIVRAWLIGPTIVYFVSGVLFYRSWRDGSARA